MPSYTPNLGLAKNAPNEHQNLAQDNANLDIIDTLIPATEKGAPNGVATLDADGFVPVEQVPPVVIERMYVCQNDTERFALTTAQVQTGDSVLVEENSLGQNITYYVKDDTNLDSEAGYKLWAAGTAAQAVKLMTARNIGNAAFDGTEDISLAQMGAAEARYALPSKISSLSTPGWYRLYTLSKLYTAYGASLTLAKAWANGLSPETETLELTYDAGRGFRALLVAKSTLTQTLTKIRLVKNTALAPAYIDVYYEGGTSATQCSAVLSYNCPNPSVVTPDNFAAAEIPDGYTSAEIDLTGGDVPSQIDSKMPTAGNENVWLLQGGTAIASNTDLNTLATSGNYYCASNEIASSLTNCPCTIAFTMKVYLSTGINTTYIHQEIMPFGSSDVWVRRSSNSGRSWVAWNNIAVSATDRTNWDGKADAAAVAYQYVGDYGASSEIVADSITAKHYRAGAVQELKLVISNATGLTGGSVILPVGTIANPPDEERVFSVTAARSGGNWSTTTYYTCAIAVLPTGGIVLRGNSEKLANVKYIAADLTWLAAT